MENGGNTTLSQDEPDEPPQTRDRRRDAYAPPRRRILIVDDSHAVRAALREALVDLPAIGEIVEAVDGIDALALLSRTPVDLILTDITMPRLDGFKFLSAVRNNPRLRDVMVIMLSALGESVDKVRGLTLGANDYVTKPFERAELLARVTVMLKMKELQEELQRKAAALERANLELERLANQDGLTGLPNRRSFFARLEIEFHRSRRFGNSLALLMLDIDHFKNFNDSYGHQVGDEALRAVGAALAGGIRSYDCAGRYGGEEFICFLPETHAGRRPRGRGAAPAARRRGSGDRRRQRRRSRGRRHDGQHRHRRLAGLSRRTRRRSRGRRRQGPLPGEGRGAKPLRRHRPAAAATRRRRRRGDAR